MAPPSFRSISSSSNWVILSDKFTFLWTESLFSLLLHIFVLYVFFHVSKHTGYDALKSIENPRSGDYCIGDCKVVAFCTTFERSLASMFSVCVLVFLLRQLGQFAWEHEKEEKYSSPANIPINAVNLILWHDAYFPEIVFSKTCAIFSNITQFGHKRIELENIQKSTEIIAFVFICFLFFCDFKGVCRQKVIEIVR